TTCSTASTPSPPATASTDLPHTKLLRCPAGRGQDAGTTLQQKISAASVAATVCAAGVAALYGDWMLTAPCLGLAVMGVLEYHGYLGELELRSWLARWNRDTSDDASDERRPGG
ncbi:hypothetical protein, partial [Nocardia sp. NPDC059228]|uniref:hypothetical protein n=1 Tax=Nocardia sp. NPDC059228 TaxID=3346777 RepID=UPI0036C8FFD3